MDRFKRDYLPDFLKSTGGKVDSASLKYVQTPQGRVIQTYSVSYSGVRRDSSSSKEGRASGFFKKFFPKTFGLSTRTTPPLVRCDGPCNAMKPSNEMKNIGICEHIICKQCFESASKVSKRDGGTGCPNEECYEEDAFRVDLKVKGRLSTRNLKSQQSRHLMSSSTRTPDRISPSTSTAKLYNPTLHKRFRNAMLDRDEETDVAGPSTSQTTYDNSGPSTSQSTYEQHEVRKVQSTIISSEVLEAPLRHNTDEATAQLITLHLLIVGTPSKWIVHEMPGEWELIEGVKTILHTHRIRGSKTDINFLSMMPNKEAENGQWIKLYDEELNMPMKRLLKDGEDLFLVLNIPIF